MDSRKRSITRIRNQRTMSARTSSGELSRSRRGARSKGSSSLTTDKYVPCKKVQVPATDQRYHRQYNDIDFHHQLSQEAKEEAVAELEALLDGPDALYKIHRTKLEQEEKLGITQRDLKALVQVCLSLLSTHSVRLNSIPNEMGLVFYAPFRIKTETRAICLILIGGWLPCGYKLTNQLQSSTKNLWGYSAFDLSWKLSSHTRS